MNLHDIPAGRLRPELPNLGAWADGVWAYALVEPAVAAPFDTDMGTTIHRRDVVGRRDLVQEAAIVLQRLERQFIVVQRAGLRPGDCPDLGLVLTRREWDILCRALALDELARHGFQIVEGARRGYRGFNLVFA